MSVRIPIFYPFAFLLIIGMVWSALRPGVERAMEWRASLARAAQDGLVVEGERLGVLIPTEQASVALEGPATSRRAVIGSVGTLPDGRADGAHYFFPADGVEAIGAHAVDVTLETRSSPVGGADMWLARCVMVDMEDSGWFEFPGTQEWSAHTLRCAVDPDAGDRPLDVMIWSDAQGDAGRIELRRIRVAPARGDFVEGTRYQARGDESDEAE